MTGMAVQLPRIRCSTSRICCSTSPDSVFTFRRIGRSRSSGLRTSRQPARKSCPPAPPIAAMRWAACRRSRSPTAGAVRESTTVRRDGPGRRVEGLRVVLHAHHLNFSALIAVTLVLCDRFYGSPVALERTLVDKAEARRLRSDRCSLQHLVNALVGITFIDAERGVVPPKIPQPVRLLALDVAHRVVTNGRVALRSPFQNPPDGPVLGVSYVLRSGEQVQVDAVLRDQQEVMDVLRRSGGTYRWSRAVPRYQRAVGVRAVAAYRLAEDRRTVRSE